MVYDDNGDNYGDLRLVCDNNGDVDDDLRLVFDDNGDNDGDFRLVYDDNHDKVMMILGWSMGSRRRRVESRDPERTPRIRIGARFEFLSRQ